MNKGLVALAALCVIAQSGPVNAQTVSIGSNPQGSSAYATAAAVAKVAAQEAGLRARVVPQGGPAVTLPLVNKGKLTYSISVSIVTAFAKKGIAMFKKRPQEKLRVVSALRNLYFGYVVPKKSNIRELSDLRGKHIPVGFSKQKIAGLFNKAVLATAGLTLKDIKGVPVPSSVRALEDLMGGKVDASSVPVAGGQTRQAHASIGIRYLTIAKTPAAKAAIGKILPGVVIETLEPSPEFAGITGPTNVLAAPFILNASADLAEGEVYKLVKTLHANKKKLVAAFKGLKGFNPDKMYVDFGVPYHAGAMKFYKEIGQVK